MQDNSIDPETMSDNEVRNKFHKRPNRRPNTRLQNKLKVYNGECNPKLDKSYSNFLASLIRAKYPSAKVVVLYKIILDIRDCNGEIRENRSAQANKISIRQLYTVVRFICKHFNCQFFNKFISYDEVAVAFDHFMQSAEALEIFPEEINAVDMDIKTIIAGSTDTDNGRFRSRKALTANTRPEDGSQTMPRQDCIGTFEGGLSVGDYLNDGTCNSLYPMPMRQDQMNQLKKAYMEVQQIKLSIDSATFGPLCTSASSTTSSTNNLALGHAHTHAHQEGENACTYYMFPERSELDQLSSSCYGVGSCSSFEMGPIDASSMDTSSCSLTALQQAMLRPTSSSSDRVAAEAYSVGSSSFLRDLGGISARQHQCKSVNFNRPVCTGMPDQEITKLVCIPLFVSSFYSSHSIFIFLSLSLSLSHTHTHTHTHSLSIHNQTNHLQPPIYPPHITPYTLYTPPYAFT